MGAFDQFKDKAEDYAEQAKGAQGGKRNRSADAQNPEQAQRGMQEEGRERRSDLEDPAQRRMGREAEDDTQDDWA